MTEEAKNFNLVYGYHKHLSNINYRSLAHIRRTYMLTFRFLACAIVILVEIQRCKI